MTCRIFTLRPDLTTREVNAAVRLAMTGAVETYADWFGGVFDTVTVDVERRRTRPYVAPGVRSADVETRYVYGIGTPLRATLVGHYVVGSGEIMLTFPNNYRGWDRANLYDRLRVSIYDRIVHGVGGGSVVIDKAVEPRSLFA